MSYKDLLHVRFAINMPKRKEREREREREKLRRDYYVREEREKVLNVVSNLILGYLFLMITRFT